MLLFLPELQQEQELDIEDCKLKAKREQLKIETAIAASTAKIKVLEDCENEYCDNSAVDHLVESQVNHQFNSCEQDVSDEQTEPLNTCDVIKPENVTKQPENSNTVDLCEVMLKQNTITEMLVKQHRLSSAPRDVPVFSGDPLEFKPFIRAFDQTIHEKSDSDSDRLYYSEQFTRGDPRDLIRSCQHMNPKQGYDEARKLLFHHYGNEIKIATAYMNKAFSWAYIKPDDVKALYSYSFFLTGCNNAMQDISQLQDIEHPTNLRTIVSKLPYKFREMWRVSAFDLQEKYGRRAEFAELVSFINRQAKIVTDPVF